MNQQPEKIISYGFLALLLLFGIFLLLKVNSKPENAIMLKHALAEDGRQAQLPNNWLAADDKNKIKGFKVKFSPGENSFDEHLLYVEYFERELSIFLNDTSITDLADFIDWRGPLSSGSALVRLPKHLLRPGANELYLEVSTAQDRIGSLSQLYIGTRDELEPYFRYRIFTSTHLKVIIFSVQISIILSCIALAVMRPVERRFIYLGISMIISSTFSLGVFSDIFEKIYKLVDWSLLLVPAGAMTFLAFVFELEKRKPHVSILLSSIIIPATLYILVYMNIAELRTAVVYLAAPIGAVVFFAACVIITVKFFEYPRIHRAFLASGLILLFGALIHDILIKMRTIDEGVLLAQSAWLFTLVSIVIFLMSYLSELASDLDDVAVMLDKKLRRREAELADIFDREKKATKKLAVESQRAHLMSELHDGVAGHLSTIVALSDMQNPEAKEIHAVARHALAELRTVIDALELPEGDLLIALASLRETVVSPLERIDLKVCWSFVDFPDVTWLSPEQTLSVLRILQEAITNAVKHGRPKELKIEGEQVDKRVCVIRVINSGGISFLPNLGEKQYGLRNIETRAQRLGGQIILTPLPDGTQFELILPATLDNAGDLDRSSRAC